MKKLSPDSEKKLAQQIEAQKQTLAILQTTVKASQNDWNARKKQIASDTLVTIETSKKAIYDALAESKQELERVGTSIQAANRDFIDMCEAQEQKILDSRSALEPLEHDKKVLVQTNVDLTVENRELSSEIIVRQAEVDTLKASETSLIAGIQKHTADSVALSNRISALTADIEQAEQQLSAATADFEAQKAQFVHELSVLELKKQDMANKIMENRAQEDKVRENLALWERKLTERDDNLRVREARVNEQEKSIVRNYNLLNM